MTIYEVLADPTRRRILDLLREQPRMVGELTELLQLNQQISQPGVSKQLRILREAGLVTVRQDAQRHWYELDPEPFRELEDWLEPYRQYMEARFQRLDSLLESLQSKDEDNE